MNMLIQLCAILINVKYQNKNILIIISVIQKYNLLYFITKIDHKKLRQVPILIELKILK